MSNNFLIIIYLIIMKITFINPEMPEAIWTIKDIVIVFFGLIVANLLFSLAIFASSGDNKLTHQLSLFLAAILGILFPLLWIRLKYGLSKEALGLRKGNFSVPTIIITGLIAAIICFLLLTPFRDSGHQIYSEKTYSIVDIFLFPLTFTGLVLVILGPFSEEIWARGFLYGYLRQKTGIVLAIFLQALFFTLFHPDIYMQGFVITAFLGIFISGIILGFLYEKTASLYPGVICHGIINYLAVVSYAYNNMTLSK